MSKRDPYPLQWPTGWKRTPNHRRTRPQFKAQFARGSHERAVELNAALASAEKELGA